MKIKDYSSKKNKISESKGVVKLKKKTHIPSQQSKDEKTPINTQKREEKSTKHVGNYPPKSEQKSHLIFSTILRQDGDAFAPPS